MKFGLSYETIQEINQVFSTYPAIQKVIIYGSRAMGNYRAGSDIDLTLLGEELSLQDLLRIHAALDDLLTPYTFDLSIYAQIDNPHLQDHIQRVGMDFYSRI